MLLRRTGAGANYNNTFVQCDPTFNPHETQSSPTSGAAASFEDDGTGYMNVDSTGHCVPMNPQPFYSSNCIVVACQAPPPPPHCTRIQTCTDGNVWDNTVCACVQGGSPIILDISGQGFFLTNANNGVSFDISNRATLATRNLQHFEDLPLTVINPWKT